MKNKPLTERLNPGAKYSKKDRVVSSPAINGKNVIFCYSPVAMTTPPPTPAKLTPEACVKSVLAWVRLAQGKSGTDLAEQLLRQLRLLQEMPLPHEQRLKLLDLLSTLAERAVAAELPRLHEISLPISRKLRQRSRNLLDTLDTLTRDYLATLPRSLETPAGDLQPSLHSAISAIAWQIRISHLIAAPPMLGIWQSLHTAFRIARQLGIEQQAGPRGTASILRIYTNTLLAGIAQPASFSSGELEFINDYIENCLPPLVLTETPPTDTASTFWIDPGKDFPAQAMIRRAPGSEAPVLYFSCTTVAETALRHRTLLDEGADTQFLALPDFAGSRTGPGILKRLNLLWGQPAKRRFPRRRQSYRAKLHTGLGRLWHLLKHPEQSAEHSEWMVTNESPDGYALMHIAGHAGNLRVGDIVALDPIGERPELPPARHICIIRWAISDNPEHIEIGLQLLATKAIAAEIADPDDPSGAKVAALILPETPPLRPLRSLVVATGQIPGQPSRIVAMVDGEEQQAYTLQTEKLDEQTGNIEIFSVLPSR